MFSLRATGYTLLAACVVRARRKRTDRPVLANNFSGESVLAESDALLATFLSASPALAIPRLDGLPILAVIVVVINVAVLGRVFRQICVIWVYFCHSLFPSRLKNVEHNTIAIRFVPKFEVECRGGGKLL